MDLVSPLLGSSPELVIGYVIEPVCLRVIAVGFEIDAVGFLSFSRISTAARADVYGIQGEDEYVPVQAYTAFPAGHPNPLHHPSSSP